MKIRKLNTLRGLAALIVAVSHFSNATGWLAALLGSGAGQLGVMIFFILSGFLLSHSYLDRGFTRKNIRHYAVARISRVVPLFLLVVVFSYVFSKAGIGALYTIDSIGSLAAHVLLLDGEDVLWAIPPIAHFYLIFVLLWWLYSRSAPSCGVVIAAAITVLFLTGFPVAEGEIGMIPYDIRLFRSLPSFLAGVVLGAIHGMWEAPGPRRSNLYVLALLIIPLMYPRIYELLAGHPHGMWNDMGVLVVLALVFAAVLFLVPDDNPVLSHGFGDFLGSISYPMYLIHKTVLAFVIINVDSSLELQLIVFLVFTFAISYGVYRLVEIPLATAIRRTAAIPGD